MPSDTHDFQLEAIDHLLDGKDVLLVIATGSGKTDSMFIGDSCMSGNGYQCIRTPLVLAVCTFAHHQSTAISPSTTTPAH